MVAFVECCLQCVMFCYTNIDKLDNTSDNIVRIDKSLMLDYTVQYQVLL